MKLLGLVAFLLTQNIFAGVKLTPVELDCVSKSTYFEARSKSPKDWEKTASVAINRKFAYDVKHRFGAKSSHLCDIVTSEEYNTNIHWHILEQDVYNRIRAYLKTCTFPYKYLFFNHTKYTSTYR